MAVITLTDELTAAKAKGEAIFAKAHEEDREITVEERGQIQAHLDEAKSLQAKIELAKGDGAMRAAFEQFGQGANPTQPFRTPVQPTMPKSLGQQWVESAGHDWIRQSHGLRGSAWNSPAVELYAATLTSDAASGGDLITPDYRPGIAPLLFKQLMVADLLAQGSTDSNLISYMKETTFTNAAAVVAEGADKQESTLIFDAVTDAVKKIAHWLPVTEEMLEDVSQIRSYIDNRLRFGVEYAVDDHLLNAGSSTGIMNRSGLTTAVARGADTNADAILKQITAIMTTAFVVPDGVVMNPANWQTIQLGKDANGAYYGSGPFASPQVSRIWGLPVAVTPTIVANTGLVGAFKTAAQVFYKGGLRVEASNSHSDFFIKNLVAIRAERRLALAVYRPAGFGKVTGLN